MPLQEGVTTVFKRKMIDKIEYGYHTRLGTTAT